MVSIIIMAHIINFAVTGGEGTASCSCSPYLVGVNIDLSQMNKSEFIVMFNGMYCSDAKVRDQYYCLGYGEEEDCYLVANASKNQRHKFGPIPGIVQNYTIFLYIRNQSNCPNSTWIFNTQTGE